jgi:hypothetical protein
MSWWQTGIVVWIAASAAVALVISRAAWLRRGRARHAPDTGSSTSEVVQPIMHVLGAVQEEAKRYPSAVARLTWVEDLLTDGYGVTLSLEAEYRRLSREIDDLLDAGGPDVQSQVAARARELRHAEHDARQLRERLDAVWNLTHAERPDTVPPDA